MALVMLPIFIMIVLNIFSMIVGSQAWFGTSDYGGGGFFISIDFWGATIIIGGVLLIIGIVGINIAGSGLTSEAGKTIAMGSGYIAIWVILSLNVFGLFLSIVGFGNLLYAALTFFYVVGVFMSLRG